MKERILNTSNFTKVESWAATAFFVFAVFSLISSAARNDLYSVWTPNKSYFEQARLPFRYYQHYFVPQLARYTLLFLSFLLLNFVIVPRILKKEALLLNLFSVGLIFLIAGGVMGVLNTYEKQYLFYNYATPQEAYQGIFQGSYLYAAWLLLVFGFYSVIKYSGIYLLSHAEAIRLRYPFVTSGGLVAAVAWMISMLLLLISNADNEVVIIWGVFIPSAILLYWYAFYALIPQSLSKKKPFRAYLFKILIVLLLAWLPVMLITFLLSGNPDAAVAISFLNVAFQLFITAPISWVLFRRQQQGKAEIAALKTELGQSHASFDFLRSQINPHFLFNALNTIYGTALQEKAERTSEGIEKLGDMMRFMLQENMQDKISLAREIDYLNNYISLQKLRTDPNPNIIIRTEIEQPFYPVQVAPMLLIPFVENAFKHGISFREPSYITVTLEVREKTLYFDVSNSKHDKPENDPEKGKSGIGLENVRQRLQLLYAGRHELVVRETKKEFFIHLTLQLT